MCDFVNSKEPFGFEQGDGSPLILPVQRRGYQLVLIQWGTLHCVPASCDVHLDLLDNRLLDNRKWFVGVL